MCSGRPPKHPNPMTAAFDKIKNYVLTNPDCADIHKMVWPDAIYLTEYNGIRHEITKQHTYSQVILLVWQIKKRQNIRKK